MATRINLWSCPRNVSTALMYSWRGRSDTRVWDEPLYAHFLRVTGIQHPSREQILAEMDQDGERVVREVILGTQEPSVLFFKQMTHHLVQLDEAFIGLTKNVLFIRDPAEIIQSYARVRQRPTLQDVGVQAQYDLWQRWGTAGHIQAVLDSKYLLLDPPGVLAQLCRLLDLPYDDAMLAWPPGPKPEDGCWAPHWYANVHQSSGFQPYQARKIELDAADQALADRCAPYYAFLTQKSIR